jgi:UDPglucose 6-dehydrogenase
MRQVVVVGAGFVGLATAVAARASGADVVVVDNDLERIASHLADLAAGRNPLHECGMASALCNGRNPRVTFGTQVEVGPDAIVFICVGTPAQAVPPRLDTRAARTAVNEWMERVPDGLVVVRSTLDMDTARELSMLDRVAICPEFMREGHAVEDALRPSRIVVGTRNEAAGNLVFSSLVGSGIPSSARYVRVEPVEASLIKLASNWMLATRAMFANAVATTCEGIPGGDAARVLLSIGMDPRIGQAHLAPSLGVGGPCLPKDKDALESSGDHWDSMSYNRGVRDVGDAVTGARLVGVLGVGFKLDSADFRGSLVGDLILWLDGVEPVLVADHRIDFDEGVQIFDEFGDCNSTWVTEPDLIDRVRLGGGAIVLCRRLDSAHDGLLDTLGVPGVRVVDAYAQLTAAEVTRLRVGGATYWGRGRGPGWPA